MANKCFPYHITSQAPTEGIELVESDGVVVAHIDNLEQYLHEFQYPCRINAIFAIVCMQGEVHFSSHLKEYTLTENMLFLSHSSVMQFRPGSNGEIYLVAFTSEFINGMNLDKRLLMPVLMSLHHESHMMSVSQYNSSRLREAFASLYRENGVERSPLLDLALKHIFCSVIYRLCDSIESKDTSIVQMSVKDRSAEYFERLITLLVEHYRTERSVEFYAEKMHISPKHLSRVIRNFTGKSVHQWIDEFVALEIKNLLRYSSMSVQQISYELNFPNPSFMGQYFKRITGMTPGQYKKL